MNSDRESDRQNEKDVRQRETIGRKTASEMDRHIDRPERKTVGKEKDREA